MVDSWAIGFSVDFRLSSALVNPPQSSALPTGGTATDKSSPADFRSSAIFISTGALGVHAGAVGVNDFLLVTLVTSFLVSTSVSCPLSFSTTAEDTLASETPWSYFPLVDAAGSPSCCGGTNGSIPFASLSTPGWFPWPLSSIIASVGPAA